MNDWPELEYITRSPEAPPAEELEPTADALALVAAGWLLEVELELLDALLLPQAASAHVSTPAVIQAQSALSILDIGYSSPFDSATRASGG